MRHLKPNKKLLCDNKFPKIGYTLDINNSLFIKKQILIESFSVVVGVVF